MTSINDLQRESDRLLREIESIKTQLGNKNKTDNNGKRMNPEEYHRWRNGAMHASDLKHNRRREIKRLIDEAKEKELKTAYQDLLDIVREQDLTPDQRRKLDQLEKIINDG